MSKRVAFTIGEVAEMLGVSRRTVLRAVNAGDIRVVKVHGIRFVPHAEMERLFGSPVGSPVENTAGDGVAAGPAPDSPLAPGPAAELAEGRD